MVMALVFLLLLTILGMTALGTSTLEEKMANNTKDRNLAFQAAESALLTGENWINAQLSLQGLFPNTSNGLYLPANTSTDGKPVWDTVSWSGSNIVVYPNEPGVAITTAILRQLGTQPKYIIEELGPMPDDSDSLSLSNKTSRIAYRVSARGTGGTNMSLVMVQSTYTRY